MFQSGYQGGPFFEIFSTQGRDSTSKWKLSNGIKKIYEKDVKGYVLTLEGTPATTKLQAPKDSKQNLTLVQRYLVVQLFVPRGADFSMEIGVADLANNKRRLLLSSAQKETQVTPLHAKIPLAVLRRAVWMNLALDMVSLVGETWTSQTFRSIDQLTISANCKVRRIFTMKSQPPDTTDDDELYGCSSTSNGDIDNIPKQCQMAHDVHHITQVITLNKIRCAERLKSGKAGSSSSSGGGGGGGGLAEQIRPGSMLELDLNSSGRKVQTSDGKIAFGSKAPKAPPDTGRKTTRQGSLTNRSLRSQMSRIEGHSTTSLSGSSQNIHNVTDSISSNAGLHAPGDNHHNHNNNNHHYQYNNNNNNHISSTSGNNNNNSLDIPPGGAGGVNKPQQAPSSAGSVHTPHHAGSGSGGGGGAALYSRQQSEPVTWDDYSSVSVNGARENPIVAPHPPRQPSNDRVRRRPRVKTIGQRGDSSYLSPPTSALVGHRQPAQDTGQGPEVRVQSSMTSLSSSSSHMKDSGVGPDVPEIQSPRKGQSDNQEESSAFSINDSVSDVISLLRGQEEGEAWKNNNNSNSNNNNNNNNIGNSWRRSAGSEGRIVEEEGVEEAATMAGHIRTHMPKYRSHRDDDDDDDHDVNDDDDDDDNDEDDDENNADGVTGGGGGGMSSASEESSHPGEYEESDEEASTETNKLHFFISPPKSAPRRNISPATAEAENNQSKKSFVKGFRSNVRRTSESSSQRGARLEDDFVSHSSSEDEGQADPLHHHHHHHHHHHPHHHPPHSRYRRPPGSGATAVSLRNNNGHHNHNHHHHRHHHNNHNHHQHHHHPQHNGSGSGGGGGSSSNGNTSGYNSLNYTSTTTTNPPSSVSPSLSSSSSTSHNRHPATTTNKGSSVVTGQSQQSQARASSAFVPETSASPDQRPPTFNPRLYSDARRKSVSRMSRRSLREITNPHGENKSEGNNKLYDHMKYQADDLTESFEQRMFASMRRQGEEVLEDISPPPGGAAGAKNYNNNNNNNTSHSQTLRSSSQFLNPQDSKMIHLYSESPATTSDDDTSFSTWKAPAPNQAPHNYQDEMKSRRSSDTLTSSNPRDWSSALSPPIDPLSHVQDLQGTMEGISDDLSDEAPNTITNNEKARKALTDQSEEEKLDLYFDSKLNCYYDPRTKKWYELLT